MRDKVLQELQSKERNKVMLSFKTETRLKVAFERICKHEGFSMSAVLNVMLKSYINEFIEDEYKELRRIMQQVEPLIQEFQEFNLFSDDEDEFNRAVQLRKEILKYKKAFVKEYTSVFSFGEKRTILPQDDFDPDCEKQHADIPDPFDDPEYTPEIWTLFIPKENSIDSHLTNHADTVFSDLMYIACYDIETMKNLVIKEEPK